MKVLFLALVAVSSTIYAQPFKSPDILVTSKLESEWSGVLISKVRQVMRNYEYPDPFDKKIDGPKLVYRSNIKSFLTPDSTELLDDLGKMLEMDFLNGRSQVVVHGLNYQVNEFKTDLKVNEDEEALIAANLIASKIKVSADKVILSLVIPGKNALPAIDIIINKPVIAASKDVLLSFRSMMRLQKLEDAFKIKLESINFGNLVTGLPDPSEISFDFESVDVPKVSIKVGNKTLDFDQKKIEKLIFSKKEGIKGILLAEVYFMLSTGISLDSMKILDKVEIKKDYWIETEDLHSYLRIEDFRGLGDLALLQMNGDFCTLEKYSIFEKKCLGSKTTKAPESRITEDNHKASLHRMNEMIEKGEANIVASISEDYINKGIASTVDAGAWDDMLKEADLKIGPNAPFIRLDEKNSKLGTLYMDLIRIPKKSEQLILGRTKIRFPLVMKVGLRIEKRNNIPVFIIYVTDIDMSDEILLYGKPELGVVSNVHKLRLKKKVLKNIREEAVVLANKDMILLEYPDLKGLELEKIDFSSDGLGRMNALFHMRNSELTIPEAN